MMTDENELYYLLLLQKAPYLGGHLAKKLIHQIGSAEAVFKEKKSSLLKIEGIGEFRIKNLKNKEFASLAEKELCYISQNGIRALSFKDPDYPDNLKHCNDGPVVIFCRGNIQLNHKRIISIVGTRKATTYGMAVCEKILDDLAPFNPVVISGFAYGIDITAHKVSLKNRLQTVACLAHGLNQMYPKKHLPYAEEIECHGGFITEFWSSDVFDRTNFLKRNRIIAGISEATLVIESGSSGGSLVTADIANSYNREVFAVPGRITDPMSRGCNGLIKTHKAHILTAASDIPYILNWNPKETLPKVFQQQLFTELTEDENKVYNYLKQYDKQHIDTIAVECKLPVFKLAPLLLTMEMKGMLVPYPGKIFGVL